MDQALPASRCLPVYSVLEGVEEVVESFSQSFSSLRLPAEGQEEKPSAESGLIDEHKPTNDKRPRGGRQTQTHSAHEEDMRKNTDRRRNKVRH